MYGQANNGNFGSKDSAWAGSIMHTPFRVSAVFLQILLTVVSGLRSFEDLRIVDGVEYPPFQAACYTLGLADSYQELIDCFTNAAG
jgi:hypothetical protein